MRRQSGRVGAWCVLGLCLAGIGHAADEPMLADYFGFLPLEVYKLDTRIAGLQTRDLDGDTIDDIIVVNNARSRIDLLLSTKRDDATPALLESEVNHLAGDKRMRHASVPVNREVVSLQTGDFNGDGKADLVFYGTPAELVILFNAGEGRFEASNSKTLNTGDAVESGTALAVGDIDRDGRDDIALLAANEVILIHQREAGKLGDPERLPHTAGNPRMLRLVDLDGNNASDLVILEGGNEAPIRVRLAVAGGKLGPEERFQVESPRAIAYHDMDGKPGAEILTIENQSGRARVLALRDAKADDPARRGQAIYFPLPAGSERGRSLAVGDLDGDGKADVVVTDPASAQFLVYRQAPKGGLGASESFPGYLGGRAVKLADLDQDKKAEVYVLSEQEKQIGRSVLADGRLTFPTALGVTGDPVALELADLDADGTPEIVYVARSRPNNTDEFTLRALRVDKPGGFTAFRWGNEEGVPLKGVPGVPPALRVLDVNRDKVADYLVFNAFGAPLLLLGRKGEAPAITTNLGPFAAATPASVGVWNLDAPSVIVSQNSFARSVALDKNGRWEYLDQFNTGKSSASVAGAAALDVDGDPSKEIVLFDRAGKSLVYLDLRDKVYRPANELKLGTLDLQAMHVADLDADGRDDLLVAGTDRFVVVLSGRKGHELALLASYESNRRESAMADLIGGDLNADGHPDVVLVDAAEHFIEIATMTGRPQLSRGASFRVFERKTFRGGADLIEPRDMALGDVDGDGRTDLVLIAHDRVLVYRQDPGPDAEKAAQAR